MRSDEDQKMAILGVILAEEIHETPDKILAGEDHGTVARPLQGPWQGPCRRHLQDGSRARVFHNSTAIHAAASSTS